MIANDQLVDRVLFRTSNAPFSKEDAQDMTDLIKTISGNENYFGLFAPRLSLTCSNV